MSEAPLTQDERDAIHARYRAERDKRLRPDGNDQYLQPSGRFADLLDDPWCDPADREPVREELDVVGVRLTVRHGPGHTPGSVSFHATAAQAPLLFTGDLLFEGSIGRTDLPGGDHAAMLRSLANVVLPLADETVVLPGHGGTTTIGRERATNPYLRGLRAAPPRKGM